MPQGLEDFEVAAQMERVMREIARSEIDRLRPAPRLAVVKSIDTATKKVSVVFTGETDTVIVPYASVAPSIVGQIVRVAGTANDRYVEEVLGTTRTAASVKAAQEAADAAAAASALVDTRVTTVVESVAEVGLVARQTATVDVPRLDNRIDTLPGNIPIEQAVYGTSGNWTMPAGAVSIEIDLIGGSPGGQRPSGTTYGVPTGAPGWVRGLMIPAGNIGAAGTVIVVTIGVGGAGGTVDGQLGANGGDTSFGNIAKAGGGRSSLAGAQDGSGTESLGNRGGGRYIQGGGDSAQIMITNGGNGFLCQGGSTLANSIGQNGEPAPTAVGLFGPGAGAGAGGDKTTGSGDGFKGGNGGYPGGPGGSGSFYRIAGFAGNGGNGSPGLAVIKTHFS